MVTQRLVLVYKMRYTRCCAVCIAGLQLLHDGQSAEAVCPLQVFLTAYLELVMLGGLSKGQSVLIHAGASGVGQLPPLPPP